MPCHSHTVWCLFWAARPFQTGKRPYFKDSAKSVVIIGSSVHRSLHSSSSLPLPASHQELKSITSGATKWVSASVLLFSRALAAIFQQTSPADSQRMWLNQDSGALCAGNFSASRAASAKSRETRALSVPLLESGAAAVFNWEQCRTKNCQEPCYE